MPDSVILVSVKDRNFDDVTREMISLVENLGAEVVLTVTIRPELVNQATYLGKGKLEEVLRLLGEFQVNTLVISDNISPVQKRELETQLKVRVLDRTEVILEIFATRALTKEAQLQVEMARLRYMLPRLTRMWSHLSRQKGGIGMRGAGEQQLETDRRVLKKRISKLREDLEKVRQDRDVQRKRRHKSDMPIVALVGYTNAGKSSLFNSFHGKSVLAKDQLFATLDTITKKVVRPEGTFYLVDTVGFITNLPHFLVESFKATLEEVLLSDLLIHVIDISHPYYQKQILSVQSVLEELGIADKPMIEVFNKCDLLSTLPEGVGESALMISVKTGQNLDKLTQNIINKIQPSPEHVTQ